MHLFRIWHIIPLLCVTHHNVVHTTICNAQITSCVRITIPTPRLQNANVSTKYKSVTPQATNITPSRIWIPWLHCNGLVETIAENNPWQCVHMHRNGSVLKTNTGYSPVQNILCVHGDHHSQPLGCSIWHPHVLFDRQRTTVCRKALKNCLWILRQLISEDDSILFANQQTIQTIWSGYRHLALKLRFQAPTNLS